MKLISKLLINVNILKVKEVFIMKKNDVINVLTSLRNVEEGNVFDYNDIVNYFGDDLFKKFIDSNFVCRDNLIFINDVNNDVVIVIDERNIGRIDCTINKVYFDVLVDNWKFL